jgi:aryl-alcohol dehydrogenase-like predicted oxidoreductase
MSSNTNLAMTYQLLGKSSLLISKIGFGCMSLQPTQKDFPFLIDQAIDNGINFFDTADLYDAGQNEINIGKAVRAKRNKVIIATKVGNQLRADGTGWDWNPRKKYIITAAEQSLRRLQTDYIDLYQLHGGTIEDPIDETIEAFELLQQQGKIRHYGISSIRPNVIREYVERSNIVSVMMQYSLVDRRPEETCLALLKKNNIGVLARGTVAGGLLAGKTATPYLGFSEAEIMTVSKAVQAVTPPNSNAATTAIRFVLQQPAITSAVVGVRTEPQLKEVLQAIGNSEISAPALNALNESIRCLFYDQHR